MGKIFLSHARRDGKVVDRIERELKKLGLSAFDPSSDLPPGENWRVAVREALKEADALVMVISSPESASTSWSGYEIGMADALDKHVIILASDDVTLSDLPSDVASYQILRFDPGSPENAARSVARQLEAAS